MRIGVFSNASFHQPYVRLGLQHMAMEWSTSGHTVEYFSCPVHPLDFLSPSRRKQWAMAWGGNAGYKHSKRLVEWIPRTMFSRRRRWWHHPSQINLYTSLPQKWLKSTQYDFAICDVSYSALFFPKIKARQKILRLNDSPEGFLHFMSPFVVNWFKGQIQSKGFDQIWAASDKLQEWALGIDPTINTRVLPNGADLGMFGSLPIQSQNPPGPPSAVFVGTFQPWFDVELLKETAKILPGWKIDIYGPPPNPLQGAHSTPNLQYCGAANHSELPSLLANYQVGLIPFSGDYRFLEAFDPIKAYQYWAAGLGIASTSAGRLRDALAPWASFGNDPHTFAKAIKTTSRLRTDWSQNPDFLNHLRIRDWKVVARKSLEWVKEHPVTS